MPTPTPTIIVNTAYFLDSTMKTLEYILSPYDYHQFMAENWMQTAIHISAGGNPKFDRLFSWEDFNYLLSYNDLDSNDIDLILNGKIVSRTEVVNPAEIFQAGKLLKFLQKGATLKFNNLQKRVPEIAEFVSQLRYEIGYSNLTVNAYSSFPGKQGFVSHYDPYEIFILQIDGAKQWKVFPDTLKYPLSSQPSMYFEPPEAKPYLNTVLEPGDVLYLPKGHWHYAIAVGKPSLHITLGIHCATGIDFLEWVVNQLRQSEDWRQNLAFPTENNSDTIKNQLSQLVEKLSDYTQKSNLPSGYIYDLITANHPVNTYSLPQQTGFYIFPKGINTRFRVPSWQRLMISQISEAEYKIKSWEKEAIVRSVTPDFLDNLLSLETFTGQDVQRWLPDLDWQDEIMPILSSLVQAGIIFVASRNPVEEYLGLEADLETWEV